MNKRKALEVLKKYNKWRRGCDKTPMPEPKDIGWALDVAIKELSKE